MSEIAHVTLPDADWAAGVAHAAGQQDIHLYWLSGSVLYVVGVAQPVLDAALASYNPAPNPEQVERALVAGFNQFLDSVAGQRRYDSRFTCALRAGFEGPFQVEGQVFATWMDECNMIAYAVMAEVKAGRAPVPSQAELIAMLPQIQWPPSPIPEGAV